MSSDKKPTLIMLHGYRGTHHGLDLIKQQLDGFKVIVPDLPGFGAEPPYKSHSMDDYVEWLDKFISNQKLSGPIVLVGHSFGSILSAAYVAKYPKKVAKLVFINPVAEPTIGRHLNPGIGLVMAHYWLGKTLPEKTARKFLSSKLFVMGMSVTMAKTRDKKLRQYIHGQHLAHFSDFYSPKTLSESFITSASYGISQFASRIKIPVLMIAADRDYLTKVPGQHKLKALFKDAKLVIIKNVGHLTHYETPDQIADAIKKFI